MRASARELLVPFFTPLVWCGRGIRTHDLPLRKRTLYQLSYRGGDREGGEMSLYSARRSVSIDKRSNRSWYSGGHMNYPADSTAKLCQGGKGRHVRREGVPVDNCSRESKALYHCARLPGLTLLYRTSLKYPPVRELCSE